MSNWLGSLPHQIPFRAASTGENLGEGRARGTRLVSAGDAMAGFAPELMLIEAMAQISGEIAFRGSGTPGSLAAIERFEITRLPRVGDLIEIETRLVTEFGGLFRFEGSARIGDEIVAHGRFYLGGGPS